MTARLQGERAATTLFGEPPDAGALVARVLATDPEIAVVGLSEAAARAAHKSIRVLRATDSHGLILGAGIVGPQARELIGIFGLAIAKQASVADLEAIASTSPTLAQACRTAALASAPQLGKAWLRPRLIR
jgi:pyruvate/2-oxoglutarate dehydrogenase complex dihydrolipoamide dehydrogenase (E3) component